MICMTVKLRMSSEMRKWLEPTEEPDFTLDFR